MNKLSKIHVLNLNHKTNHLWNRTDYNNLTYNFIQPGDTYLCLGIIEGENLIYLLNDRGMIVGVDYNENIFREV